MTPFVGPWPTFWAAVATALPIPWLYGTPAASSLAILAIALLIRSIAKTVP